MSVSLSQVAGRWGALGRSLVARSQSQKDWTQSRDLIFVVADRPNELRIRDSFLKTFFEPPNRAEIRVVKEYMLYSQNKV